MSRQTVELDRQLTQIDNESRTSIEVEIEIEVKSQFQLNAN